MFWKEKRRIRIEKDSNMPEPKHKSVRTFRATDDEYTRIRNALWYAGLTNDRLNMTGYIIEALHKYKQLDQETEEVNETQNGTN